MPEPPSSRSVDADSPRRPDRSDRPPTRSHPLVEDENSDEDVGPVSSNAVGTKRKADGEVDGEDQIEQNGDEDSDFEDDGDAEVDRTPVSHEIVLKDHTKVCLSAEHRMIRLIHMTGGLSVGRGPIWSANS